MTSGDNNFNDFSENQLTIDFAFCASLLSGTLLYHRSYHLGEQHSPPKKNICSTAFPLVSHPLYNWSTIETYCFTKVLIDWVRLNVPPNTEGVGQVWRMLKYQASLLSLWFLDSTVTPHFA